MEDYMFGIIKGRICAAARHQNKTAEFASSLMTNRLIMDRHTALDIVHKLGMPPTYVVEVNKYFKLYDALKEKGIAIPQERWSA